MRLALRSLLVVLLPLLVACRPASLVPTPTPLPVSVTPEVVRFVYPESAEPLVRGLVSAYQREHPAVQIVLLERADALAWQALEREEADLALLSRLPVEPSADVWRVPLARDGLAVVVNPQNGLPGVTLEQLRDLFQGRVADWTTWGGLPGPPQVISREEASGEYQLFQERVMGDFPVALTALLAPTSEALVQMLEADPLAVGYLSSARLNDRVRPLAIEGVPPTAQTLASEAYPLTRDWQLVLRGAEPVGRERDLTQWLVGPQARPIISAQGWLPLTTAGP
ncbi:MAG: substrate-binding domain-containing protein [Anaerolineales bacterium]